MKYCLLIALIFTTGQVYSQKTFTIQELIEDITAFANILIQNDPLTTKFEKAKAVLSYYDSVIFYFKGDNLTAFEFARYMFDLRPPTKFDAHASATFTDSLPQARLFPIPLIAIDRNLVVNSDDAVIPFGSIIYSINGEKTEDILRNLTGNNANNFGLSNLANNFSGLYLLKYGSQEKFIIEYRRDINQKIKSIDIPGANVPEYMRIHNKRIFPKYISLFNNKYFADIKTYYFQLNSFDIDGKITTNNFNDFKNIFDSIFTNANAKNATNLILDLRYNGGGQFDIPMLLFSYLYDSSFSISGNFIAPQTVVTKNITSVNNEPVIDENEGIKKLTPFSGMFKKQGDIAIANFDSQYRPQQKPFKGNLFILTGGLTYSAAALFVAIAKAHNRGKIVGEKVGGSIYNSTAGINLSYRLPNTKLEVTTPLIYMKFNDTLYQKVPEKNITPDITFPFDLKYKYFLQKKDVDLEETLLLIRKEQQGK